MDIEVVYTDGGTNNKERAVEDHAQGMTQLGKGAYSAVYGQPGLGYVVKVMSGSDMGYYSWFRVAQCFKQQSQYLPRVFRAVNYRYRDVSDYQYTASDNPRGHDYEDCWVFYLEQLTHPLRRTWNSNTGEFTRRRWIDRWCNAVAGMLYKIHREKWDYSHLSARHRDMLTLLIMARESLKDGIIDLHGGNAMLRQGQVVITDPLV